MIDPSMSGRGQPQDGVDLRRYVRLAWGHKWAILAVLILIPTATYLVSRSQSKVYEASTLLKVQPQGISLSGQASVSTSGASETARVLRTTAVAKNAAAGLGDDPSTAGSLLGAIDVQTEEETVDAGFMTITARADDPDRAAAIANAFAAAITQTRANDAIEEIDETIDALSRSGGDVTGQAALAEQLQQLRAARAAQSDATQVIEPAAPPAAAISPNPGRNARIAFIFAILAAVGLVPLLEIFNRRLREPRELTRIFDAPLLGAIPDTAFSGEPPDGQVREAFQTLRAALTYFNIDRTLSKVLVTSPDRGEGKTTVATNLAIALARDGRNVILIDCDLRRPRVAARYGVQSEVHYGLDTVLAERKSLGDALVEVEVSGGRLQILPGGTPPDPSVILASDAMRTMLARLSEQVDMLVLDTPPLLAVSDAIPLLEQVSGTILIARMDQTRREDLRATGELISNAGGDLLGLVATGIQTGGVYGYAYGYGYGYVDERSENGAVASSGSPSEAASRSSESA